MAKNAWLAVPIAVVVVHRLASSGGATTATATLVLLAAATFAALLTVGLLLRRLGVTSRTVGFILAGLFWLSAPNPTWPDWVGSAEIGPAPLALAPVTETRDLILIMIDDHPSSRALLTDHGYDNAEFQLELADRGFQEIPEAWSNSSHPLLAVTAALSGRYPGTPGNEWDRRRIAGVLDGDNPVADLLRDNGYSTTHLVSPSAVSTWLGRPDGGTTVDDLTAAIDAAITNDRRDFVFAHLTECNLDVTATDEVVRHARCNNRLMAEALDHLDVDARIGPIVAVAGTRGSDIEAELRSNPAAWPRSAVVRGLGVFSAVRLAPGCQAPPDDATVAVVVHHAMACALGAPPDPPLERAVVIDGDLVDPDGVLDVNLDVLRSSLAGSAFRTSR